MYKIISFACIWNKKKNQATKIKSLNTKMSSKPNFELQEDSPLYHNALQISIKTQSFYCHDTILVKEDDDVECIGNLSFSYEQLLIKARRFSTRRHISSVSNGMLNDEEGGIILMEVHDGKCVKGFSLSRSQLKHIVLNIVNTLSHFMLPVQKHFYPIAFIKVINSQDTKEPLMKTSQLPPLGLHYTFRTHNMCLCNCQMKDLRNFFPDFHDG
jgi:hypothetical protein